MHVLESTPVRESKVKEIGASKVVDPDPLLLYYIIPHIHLYSLILK